MKHKDTWTNVLYIILFVAVFVLLQFLSRYLSAGCIAIVRDIPFRTAMNEDSSGTAVAVTTVISSLLTFALFTRAGWAPVSRTYLRSRPWGVFFWAFLLAAGSILPMEFVAEKINLTLPSQTQQLFESIMRTSWGYLALGIMAPIAEEVVFRGAVLRTLLDIFSSRAHWAAIVFSALVFGAIHLNLAQGTHAFLVGLLLGWMYYRTGSILPGVLFHWVNNTVAYLMFNFMPQMNDGKLIDLFHGSERMMYGGLFFSLCILVPSILQLGKRMGKVKGKKVKR